LKTLRLETNPMLHVLYQLPFGSRIYGAHNKESDYDFICIVSESTGQFVLQHKSVQSDYLYVGIDEFIQGALDCSNPEFFEALHTDEGLKFLQENNMELIEFYNTRTAKAFLGVAKRDIKADYLKRYKYIVKNGIIAAIILDGGRIDLHGVQALVDLAMLEGTIPDKDVCLKQLIDFEKENVK
jgi:hypothetical protein